MIFLLYGHDLPLLKLDTLCEEPRVFLDKTCIHQTDLKLQRQGILSLAAYLQISDEMLIVYRNSYLKKLWTVYELASMLMLKPKPRITIVTTHLTLLLFCWWGCLYGYVLLQVFAGSRAVQEAAGEDLASLVKYGVQYGTMLPLMAPFFLSLRRFGLERRGMHKAAAAFCIRSTMCFVEDDRQVVQRNVVSFMRDFGFVSHCATEDEALDAFDQVARKLVPLHLDASFGAGMVYQQVAAMMLPFCGWCADIVSANLSQGFSVRWYVAEVLYLVGVSLGLFPVWFALCLHLTSRCPDLDRVRTVPFMAIVSLVCVGSAVAWDTLYTWLFYEAIASWGGFTAFSLAVAALAILVVYIYRPRTVPAEAAENCKVRAHVPLSSADIRHDML